MSTDAVVISPATPNAAPIQSDTTNSSDPMDDEFQSPDVPVCVKLSYSRHMWL